MNVIFYKMKSPNNSINKNKTQIQESDCQLYENTDILDPKLIMRYNSNIIECNYIFIPEFKRYYFINNIEIVDGVKVIINCHVDVLESYWDDIKNTYQHVVRNQYQFNMYMKDDTIQTTQRILRQVKTFEEPEDGFPFLRTPENEGHNFVLNSL